MNDEFFMRLGLNEAWKYQLLTYPNPAVGCVVVAKNGEILSVQAHQKAGTFHAELRAIISALGKINKNFNELFNLDAPAAYEQILKHHNNLLCGAKVYVSLEPCSHFGRTPPCATLLKELKISQIIIGVMDKNSHGGAKMLADAGILVKSGVLKNECARLIEPFMLWSGLSHTNSKNFTLFKTAMSLNGVISGKISQDLARAHCHQIRSLIDLIVIGGNTARIDNPRLDARFSNSKKAPDVLIYSQKQNFNPNLALFKIPARKVQISANLAQIKEKNFVMIEGVDNLLKALKNDIHWLLIYQNKSFMQGNNFDLELSLDILHQSDLGDDCALWCKIKN